MKYAVNCCEMSNWDFLRESRGIWVCRVSLNMSWVGGRGRGSWVWVLVWVVGVGKLNVVGKKNNFSKKKKLENEIIKICKIHETKDLRVHTRSPIPLPSGQQSK